MPVPPPSLRFDAPLAPLTTLGVGGAARALVEVEAGGDAPALRAALLWAEEAGWPVFVLGGGSNLLVADEGFPGLVVRLSDRRLQVGSDGTLSADAGTPWEAVVEASLNAGLAGLECLAGIPGTAGAAPIQNVGAYGQEVSDTLDHVRVFDRAEGRIVRLGPDECAFAYRDSVFKHQPDRFVVLEVVFRLRPGGAPTLRYEELRRAVESGPGEPTLRRVAETVRMLRRNKAMFLDAEVLAGPDGRSAGSFFMNPVLEATAAASLPAEAPRHAQADGRLKVPAAWLIERAGITRGTCLGPAAVSTRHTLALVNRGGASARDLVRLAALVRRTVRRRFGVTLQPEPVFLGFGARPAEILDAAERALDD